mgnify:CR=1 FL=1
MKQCPPFFQYVVFQDIWNGDRFTALCFVVLSSIQKLHFSHKKWTSGTPFVVLLSILENIQSLGRLFFNNRHKFFSLDMSFYIANFKEKHKVIFSKPKYSLMWSKEVWQVWQKSREVWQAFCLILLVKNIICHVCHVCHATFETKKTFFIFLWECL